MQYQVPQFIEMEDKIVGPLTLRQFGYLAAGGILCLFIFFALKTFYAVIASIPVASAAFGLAFVKINGIALPKYLVSLLGFALKPQLYLWKKK